MMQIGKKKIVVMSLFIVVMLIGTLIYNNDYFPKRQNYLFGVTYMTMNNTFYEVINNELLKEIENRGDQLLVRDPALDIDKQIEQIYDFIDEDVDGIFINPVDSKKVTPALKAAKKAGIPIIVMDASIEQEQFVDCTIVSDNYDAGVQCAKDMMKRLKSANIVLLKHTNVQSAKDRIDGFLETIDGYSQYQIIDQGECEGQLELAMPIMEDILEKNKDIDVVMSLNDPSALGALAALQAYQYHHTIVYGVDGTPDIKTLIGNHSMVAGTVAQSPISIGNIAAQKMYELLRGKAIEKNIIIPVQLINENNITKYDQTGWQ